MVKIKVVVADDHAVLRAGLRLLINSQPDMCVIGEAGTFLETVDVIRDKQPDVVTLDLSMPGGTGNKLIESLTRDFPLVRVLVLTMHDDPAYFRTALAAGAAGYVVKKSADSELLTAIRTVASGRSYARVELKTDRGSNEIRGEIPGHTLEVGVALDQLSSREREVLVGIARGHTNQAIADRLLLSVKTIESYRARLMAKLGLKNRAELTKFALDIGLLANDEQFPDLGDHG
ncbi:MAG TPA: response regulator transcription factor [Pirellulaceae bacterium]|nr:response regulator transcription factor [Pirellulaceae bacterium]